MEIWKTFIQSNTFNFVVFALIFAWIFKKIDIKKAIAGLQNAVVEIIEAAKKEKQTALKELKSAKSAVKNLPKEVEKILSDADKNADILSKKVLADAKKQAENIELNAQKLITAEEKAAVSSITQKAAKASVDKALADITAALEKNPELHNKFIEDSIDELDRLTL